MTRPASTKVQLVRGDRPSRIRGAGPVPPVGDGPPAAPSWLSDGGRAIWTHLAPLLSEAGRLTPLDVDNFAVYCENVDLHRQAAELIAKDGIVVKGHRGALRKHPAWQVLRDSAAMVRAGAHDFGLTPLARASLPNPTKPTPAEITRLLS
jgi:P27 family predicted phage terminase small subunit